MEQSWHLINVVLDLYTWTHIFLFFYGLVGFRYQNYLVSFRNKLWFGWIHFLETTKDDCWFHARTEPQSPYSCRHVTDPSIHPGHIPVWNLSFNATFVLISLRVSGLFHKLLWYRAEKTAKPGPCVNHWIAVSSGLVGWFKPFYASCFWPPFLHQIITFSKLHYQ